MYGYFLNKLINIIIIEIFMPMVKKKIGQINPDIGKT